MSTPGLQSLARQLAESQDAHRPWTLRLLPDAEAPTLLVGAPRGDEVRLPVDWRAGRLGHTAVAEWIAQQDRARSDHVLAAPAIGSEVATRLREAGRSFLDCRGQVYLHLAAGRWVFDLRPARAPRREGVEAARAAGIRRRASPAGARVLFVLLVEPTSLGWTIRQLAAASGTSNQSVSGLLASLRAEGSIVRTGRTGHAWATDRPHALIDAFAQAWAGFLRPSLVETVLESSLDAPDFVSALERVLAEQQVRFGLGGTAGAECIQPWYRGRHTVVHVDGTWQPAWNRSLRAAPTGTDGSIVVLRTMGSADLEPEAAHARPLLLYAELITSADPREREFAERLLPDILRSFEADVRAME